MEQFEGHQQHDCQELICFILDKLHEDLNRIKSKPVVEGTEKKESETDLEAGRRAWVGYKKRNHSKVVDLFFGQLRSKLTCPSCSGKSITFDPFNFVTLPIPKSFRKELRLYFVFYEFEQKSKCLSIFYSDPEFSVLQVKEELEKIVRKSSKNIMIGRLSFRARGSLLQDSQKIDPIRKEVKKTKMWDIFAFEVSNEEANLATNPDTVHAFSLVTLEGKAGSWLESKKKIYSFIRPFFFNPKTKSQKIHFRFFHFLRKILNFDQTIGNMKHNTEQEVAEIFKSKKSPFKIFVKKELSDPSNPELFKKQTNEDDFEVSIKDNNWVLEKSVPQNKDGSKICEIEVLFSHKSPYNLERLASCEARDPGSNNKAQGEESFSLEECLKKFEELETLDEHNAWFCRNCNAHVMALKELRLFKVPDILVIQLRRFKEREHNLHGHHTSVGSKISTLVNFPLEGLNIREFVMSPESIEEDYKITEQEIYQNDNEKSKSLENLPLRVAGRSLVYDLYAVSNHFGSMTSGHYTAFVRQGGTWFNFDDSKVVKMEKSKVVSKAAYVLFYRRRK